MALGILDQMEAQGKIRSLLDMEHNSAEYLHTLVETLRCAI
jgi:gamma-glutamyltranspeptidase / glutathione hydrolase